MINPRTFCIKIGTEKNTKFQILHNIATNFTKSFEEKLAKSLSSEQCESVQNL